MKYSLVQVTEDMDWPGFVRRVIEPPDNSENKISAELELGIAKGLPTGKLNVSLGSSQRESDKHELLDKISKSWAEHDVCRAMAYENTALFIDDFESAIPELARRIASMGRLLTQSYVSQDAKLIIVGADDVYRRLYEYKPTLKGRLEQISIGTLARKQDSWKFLQLGFEALGLSHPANDIYATKADNAECMEAVYEAADGLPKSLNELGRDISLKGEGRKRVTPADVKKVASRMPEVNLRLYRGEFPNIIKCVERNTVVQRVLAYLYEVGIGHIHYWDDVLIELRNDFDEAQVENALCELVDVEFLVRTGLSGEVLYCSKPNLAHTLGVVTKNAAKYNIPRSLYGDNGQLVFDFLKRDESFLVKLPNEQTLSAIAEAMMPEHLPRFENTDDLFNDLGI